MDIWNTPPPTGEASSWFYHGLSTIFVLSTSSTSSRPQVTPEHSGQHLPLELQQADAPHRPPNTHAALGGGGGKELLTDPQRCACNLWVGGCPGRENTAAKHSASLEGNKEFWKRWRPHAQLFLPQIPGDCSVLHSCLMSSADNWLDESLMKAQFTDRVPQTHTDTQVNRKRHALQIKKKYTLEGFVFPVGGKKNEAPLRGRAFGLVLDTRLLIKTQHSQDFLTSRL